MPQGWRGLRSIPPAAEDRPLRADGASASRRAALGAPHGARSVSRGALRRAGPGGRGREPAGCHGGPRGKSGDGGAAPRQGAPQLPPRRTMHPSGQRGSHVTGRRRGADRKRSGAAGRWYRSPRTQVRGGEGSTGGGGGGSAPGPADGRFLLQV